VRTNGNRLLVTTVMYSTARGDIHVRYIEMSLLSIFCLLDFSLATDALKSNSTRDDRTNVSYSVGCHTGIPYRLRPTSSRRILHTCIRIYTIGLL